MRGQQGLGPILSGARVVLGERDDRRPRNADGRRAGPGARVDGANFDDLEIEEDRVEVYGPKGKLAIDRSASVEARITGPTRRLGRLADLAEALRFATRPGYLVQKLRSPLAEPSYAVALGRFVAAVRTGTPAAPDLDDGYRSLAVVIAAEEAVRGGQSVPVPEAADGS